MEKVSDSESGLEGVLEFTYEFVSRMRKRADLVAPPSVRQTQSIPKLISARYFRNGRVSHQDFVEVAVFTSSPEDKEIAREIAEDIVLGTSSRKIKRDVSSPTFQNVDEDDELETMIKKIRRERELASGLEKDEVEAGSEYLDELKKREKTPELEIALEYLSEGEIILKGLRDDDELRDAAASKLLDRLGGLESEDFPNAETLGVLDRLTVAPNAAEQLASRALRGDEDIIERFTELTTQDPATASRALRHMDEMGVLSDSESEQMHGILEKSLKDLGDAAEYAHHLKRTPGSISEHITDSALRFPLIDALEFSKHIMEQTGEDFAEEIMEAYDTEYEEGASENVDMSQLSDAYRNGTHWKSLLKKETQQIIGQAELRTSASDYLRKHLQEMAGLRGNLTEDEMKEDWAPAMKKIAEAAVKTSPTQSHLRDTVRIASELGVHASPDVIRSAAKKLQMTDSEIKELLEPSYQVLEKLVKEGNSGYERLHHLIQSAGLDYDQLKELADLAVEFRNKDAVSAISHTDLQAALGRWQGKTMPDGSHSYLGKVSEERADEALEGLLSGPATDVIKAWYRHRKKLPKPIAQKLRQIAKSLLIDLGSRFAKQTMGSSMLGGIQESTTVRPFRLGDDIDMISLEETMDALLAQGQTSFGILNYEDFLVTQPYQGHRAFFWALDKSKSMDSPEKLGMLALSVMAGLFGIKKDDFGVVLFDHETHIVKEISQRNVSVEDVASRLLDVSAGGGTGAAHSIQLAIRNLEESRAKEKFFFLSSDAELSDQNQCKELAQQLKQCGIKFFIIVPQSSYDAVSTQDLASAGRGKIVDISSIEELPRKLLVYANY